MLAALIQNLGYSVYRIGSQRWPVEDLFALHSHILRSAVNIREGLIADKLLLPILDGNLYLEIRESDDYLVMAVVVKQGQLPNWLLDLFNLTLSELSWARDWHLSRILTPQSKDPRLVDCPLRVEHHTQLQLWLDQRSITEPNPTADPVQFSLHSRMLQTLRQQGSQPEDLLTSVKRAINRQLSRGITLEQVASQMQLTPRTLQRRLKYKNSSFSLLLEEQRQTQALARLSKSGTVAEIATALGYDEPANFNRAFRKWYGISPSQYRSAERRGHLLQSARPIQLHYALDYRQHEYQRLPQGGQIWLELANLAFEKHVWVECVDRDGVWRQYPAAFAYFLRDGVELWSTSILPVATPLRFRIGYEVDGQRYIDDNQGRDYLVSGHFCLGQPDIVCHNVIQVREGQGWRVSAQVICKATEQHTLVGRLEGKDTHRAQLTCVSHHANYQLWQLSCWLDDPVRSLILVSEPDEKPGQESDGDDAESERPAPGLQPSAVYHLALTD